ncbi:MAG: (deoxy)nucleoside triphosphate pyrophosphohydrolase [Firmicutes bacterium HGW-Firmicutes-1]|jgi:8-oxo-dGTP diphosphatase|nr:MAG: (deoxy)nucleoside triphosphate pyrophosphohydrolase [Firmicutes bacterium HGW-Firmicutes-1]
MKHYVVTAAIIIEAGEILCMQRNAGKYDYVSFKFEFPGGKVEPDETVEQALSRELKEEMDITISVNPEQFFISVQHQYPDFYITMHSYLCPIDNRTFTRKEHLAHVWLKPGQLDTLDWAPADLPIVRKLMDEMR